MGKYDKNKDSDFLGIDPTLNLALLTMKEEKTHHYKERRKLNPMALATLLEATGNAKVDKNIQMLSFFKTLGVFDKFNKRKAADDDTDEEE